MVELSTVIHIIAKTFEVFGAVLIAYTVMSVHTRVREEHNIDSRVLTEMQRERVVVIAGILLIVFGYLLDMYKVLLM